MHASHGFTPMPPGLGFTDDVISEQVIASRPVPVCDLVPLPRRWLEPVQPLPAYDGHSERFQVRSPPLTTRCTGPGGGDLASQRCSDELAVFRVLDDVVDQGPAFLNVTRSSGMQDFANGFDDLVAHAGTVPGHLVGHNPSVEPQGVRVGELGGQWTENLYADPNDVIPISLSFNTAPVYTLLVSNVSRRISQDDVLRYWPCHAYNYDLLYLAYEVKKRRGSGWLFVNFMSHEDASDFRDQWHGTVHPFISRRDDTGDMRPLQIDAAKLQGFRPNVAHWRQALRRNAGASFVPALFIGGQRVDFWQYGETQPVPAVQVV